MIVGPGYTGTYHKKNSMIDKVLGQLDVRQIISPVGDIGKSIFACMYQKVPSKTESLNPYSGNSMQIFFIN